MSIYDFIPPWVSRKLSIISLPNVITFELPHKENLFYTLMFLKFIQIVVGSQKYLLLSEIKPWPFFVALTVALTISFIGIGRINYLLDPVCNSTLPYIPVSSCNLQLHVTDSKDH